MEEERPAEPRVDRRVRLASLGLWAIGLVVVLVRGLDLVLYAFVTAYVLGILYALYLRDIDDPEGGTAIWWALIVPPLAWWTFVLHWLEHRHPPAPDTVTPDEVTPDPVTRDEGTPDEVTPRS